MKVSISNVLTVCQFLIPVFAQISELMPAEVLRHAQSIRTCLQFALACYKAKNSEKLWAIVELICSKVHASYAITELRQFIRSGNMIKPSRLQAVGNILVDNSAFPIQTCLQFAKLVKRLQHRFVIVPEFQEISHRFGLMAEILLDGIESDVVASIVLTQKDETGESAMDIAVRTQNQIFLAHPRIGRIQNVFHYEVK